MSITIKKNLKPTFEIIGMLCDKPLSKDLNKYELTRFLNCHSTNLLNNAIINVVLPLPGFPINRLVE